MLGGVKSRLPQRRPELLHTGKPKKIDHKRDAPLRAQIMGKSLKNGESREKRAWVASICGGENRLFGISRKSTLFSDRPYLNRKHKPEQLHRIGVRRDTAGESSLSEKRLKTP